MLERTADWLSSRPTWLWRALALSIVTALALTALFSNSLVVDGTRYFWLDDDQMISMRYARNLADGHGLVWNPGERVEGYTNFLWIVVMAGVHLLPLDDAHTSLVVRLLNLGLLGVSLLFAERILRRFRPALGLALPALWLPLAFCYDMQFWAFHGFETTLLMLVFLWVVDRILEDSAADSWRWTTYLLLGLLPLIRSDAHHLWMVAAILAFLTAGERGRTLRWLGLAALPALGHLLFRHAYYGEWFPNTYYLKVAGHGLARRLELGLDYLAYFATFYWMALLLALLGALQTQDRRRRWLFLGFLGSLGYVAWVGGDMYPGARFLAPYVPLLLALALAAIGDLAQDNRAAELALSAALALGSIMFTAFLTVYGSGYAVLEAKNGGPDQSLVAALAIRENSSPDARVAVHAAGVLPYFSRRYCIDMLGKTDPVVSRLQPRKYPVGHNKYEPEHSLGAMRADMVAMLWLPRGAGSCSDEARAAVQASGPTWVSFIYQSSIFQREFCGNVVEFPGAAPIYVRRTSPEAVGLPAWRPPVVGR